MHIRELFPDVISEDLDYEYKTVLNPDKPIKWAKTIVGYANGNGGIMFVGVPMKARLLVLAWTKLIRQKSYYYD